MKDLCVVYLTHNRKYYTGITLPNLVRQCRHSNRFGELLIYDDDSKDGTNEVIDSINYDFNCEITYSKFGNTVDQFNDALLKTKCKYIYYIGNDILLPDVFDDLCGWMDRNDAVMSAMIQEANGMPYYEDLEYEYHSFTSSLGIHRKSCFNGKIPNEKRFFGFQPFQAKMMRENDFKVVRFLNIGNTNLDMSCWSKQNEYAKLGYGRTGLVSSKESAFNSEI